MRRSFLSVLLAALVATALPVHAAETFPDRPIRLLVGIGAGSATDVAARLVAKKLGERLGQQIIVDNRPGAGGTLACDLTAKSPPDGYTLLWATSSIPMFRLMYNNLRFDPDKDFVAVGGAAQGAMVLLVKNDPQATLDSLITRARAKPNSVSYASAGVGSNGHLASEVMGRIEGVQFLHVPYKSSQAGVIDMLGGQIDFVMDGLASSLGEIKGGRLKALGVTTTKRSSFLPDVPTLSEAGVKGFSHPIWLALFAPVGTPKSIVEKLSSELHSVVSTNTFRDELASLGLEPFPIKSDDLNAQVRSESEAWTRKLQGMKLMAE